MLKNFNRVSFGLACLTIATLAPATQEIVPIKSLGTTTFSSAAAPPADTDLLSFKFRGEPAGGKAAFKAGLGGLVRVPASNVPTPASNALAIDNAGLYAFNGITHRDQRFAGGGNQLNLEPPDQGLAVGNAYVVEAVNDAMAVYDKSGNLVGGPTTLSSFFGLPPTIDHSTGLYGPFISDPRVYYDGPTQRWFVTLTQVGYDPFGTGWLPPTNVLIGVSQTSNPLGNWNLFAIDTTNSSPGGPYFGDQPLIGADANGFFVTTNEFPLFTLGNIRAQVYAMSKTGLENNTPGPVVHFGNLPLAEGTAYSVQPATTPPGGSYDSSQGGTEYFLSALEFTNTLDNRIAVWALTNTSSLNTASPSVTLTSAVLSSEVYGRPPFSALEQDGFRPLAETWMPEFFGVPTPPIAKCPLLIADDDRMYQVVFANGKLWSCLNTVLKPSNGPPSAGIAWFAVTPSVSAAGVAGTVTNQGYVAYSKGDLLYGAIGMNNSGHGVITFTLTSPNSFPSAAYALIDGNGVGSIHVALAGFLPDDGYVGYDYFLPGLPRPGESLGMDRWGDYSAASADEAGNIWFATEYIPNLRRSVFANWGTGIGTLTP